jgi:hypothetical protein
MRAYISAESKKLTPASKAMSRRRIELAAPFCCPIVIVPARTQYARAESVSAKPQRERERECGTEAEAGDGRQVGSELQGRRCTKIRVALRFGIRAVNGSVVMVTGGR